MAFKLENLAPLLILSLFLLICTASHLHYKSEQVRAEEREGRGFGYANEVQPKRGLHQCKIQCRLSEQDEQPVKQCQQKCEEEYEEEQKRRGGEHDDAVVVNEEDPEKRLQQCREQCGQEGYEPLRQQQCLRRCQVQYQREREKQESARRGEF